MQKGVQPRPIDKCKIRSFGSNGVNRGGKVLIFPQFGGADVIWDPVLLKKIEYVRTAIHSAWFKRALFLRKIEERNMLERNIVEVEIALEAEPAFDRARN